MYGDHSYVHLILAPVSVCIFLIYAPYACAYIFIASVAILPLFYLEVQESLSATLPSSTFAIFTTEQLCFGFCPIFCNGRILPHLLQFLQPNNYVFLYYVIPNNCHYFYPVSLPHFGHLLQLGELVIVYYVLPYVSFFCVFFLVDE